MGDGREGSQKPWGAKLSPQSPASSVCLNLTKDSLAVEGHKPQFGGRVRVMGQCGFWDMT